MYEESKIESVTEISKQKQIINYHFWWHKIETSMNFHSFQAFDWPTVFRECVVQHSCRVSYQNSHKMSFNTTIQQSQRKYENFSFV